MLPNFAFVHMNYDLPKLLWYVQIEAILQPRVKGYEADAYVNTTTDLCDYG